MMQNAGKRTVCILLSLMLAFSAFGPLGLGASAEAPWSCSATAHWHDDGAGGTADYAAHTYAKNENNQVYCSVCGRTFQVQIGVKPLAVGGCYFIGDTIYFDDYKQFPFPATSAWGELRIYSSVCGMQSYTPEQYAVIPTPRFANYVDDYGYYPHGVWYFENALGRDPGTEPPETNYTGSIMVAADGTSRTPIGVKCSGIYRYPSSSVEVYCFEAIYSIADTWTWSYAASGKTITATCAGPDAIEPQTVTLRDYSRPYAYETPVSPVYDTSAGWNAENGLPTPSFSYESEFGMYDDYRYRQGYPGSYTVTMTVEDESVQASYTITTRPASDLVYTPPTPITGLAYNDEAQALFQPGSVFTPDCQIYYKCFPLIYNPFNFPEDDLTPTVRREFEAVGNPWDLGFSFYGWETGSNPQYEESCMSWGPGFYMIGYAVRHNFGGYANAYGYILVEIDKAVPPHPEPPDVIDVTYGQRLSDIPLPEGWRFTQPTVTWVGAYNVSICFEVEGDDAYKYKTLYHTVLTRAAKRPLTVTADPITKTAGETDPALTYTVDGLLSGDAYLLNGALERAPGEEPGTYAITLGTLNAGNKYDVRFVGSTFTIEAQDTPHDKQSVTIDDQISVNFLLDLDVRKNLDSVQIAYYNPVTGEVEDSFSVTDFNAYEKKDGLYKIPAVVAPAQLNDTICVTISADGKKTVLSTSVVDYCNTLLESDQPQAVKTLAAATLEYGQAANDYFADAGLYAPVTFFGTANAQEAIGAVQALDSTLSVDSGIFNTASFVALTQPEFRFYVNPDAGLTEARAASLNGQITVSGAEGVTAQFVKNESGSILLEVVGVEAETMDAVVTVSIGDFTTVAFSGYDFARIMANNAGTATLGAALYNYGEAAKECFKSGKEN